MSADLGQLKSILSKWGEYGPHFDERGRLLGFWWTPLDVDSMSDEELVLVAREIAHPKEAA